MSTHRFVLPRSDGSWLINPKGGDWPALAAGNQESLAQADVDCQGRKLAELRSLTQRQIRDAASRYTSQLLGRDVAVPQQANWIVTGHQPDLFHPGVWAKNFAVHHVAKTSDSVGLNLIIDNDVHAGLGVAVPTGNRIHPTAITVPFDQPRPAAPWEEMLLEDVKLFRSFATRVEAQLQPWGVEPVLTAAWPAALAFAANRPSVRLADCLAAMRATLEHRWGAGNLELPLSQAENSTGFFWFTAHLLAQLPRFQPLYNSVVQDYRRRQKLRSRTHPVSDLAVQDDWIEAPFWIWRQGDAVRDRLFARQHDAEIELRDRREIFLRLPLTPDRSACCAVEELARLAAMGIRLRSRALTTTLFARLFLSDLFVHGIGGAKYDEMTDEFIAKFYGLPVPAYATISATLNLPLGGRWNVGPQQIGETTHQLRDVHYNPERHAGPLSADQQRLVAEKQLLITEQQTAETSRPHDSAIRNQNRQRYLRIREINRLLQSAAADSQQELIHRREELLSHRSADRILGSRDFAAVLFPEDRLREFLTHPPLES